MVENVSEPHSVVFRYINKNYRDKQRIEAGVDFRQSWGSPGGILCNLVYVETLV